MTWPSPERERQLLADAANPADALRAMQLLITRIRALERRESELCEMLWMASHRVRELEKREAALTALLKKTDALLDQLEASDELSESYETGVAEVHLPIIVALKGTP